MKLAINQGIRRVKQDDRTGCGIACIAIITGESYERIRSLAINELRFSEDGPFYTQVSHLKILASKFGIELPQRIRKFKNWESLPDVAIVAINYCKESHTWHWVVYRREKDSQYVIDPKKSVKSNKRTDFGRMKPKWFLPVIIT